MTRQGFVLNAPVVPVLPVRAQFNHKARYLHLELPGDRYVNAGTLTVTHSENGKFPPSVQAEIDTAGLEPSYSGSGKLWTPVMIDAAEDGRSAELWIGKARLCRVVVVPGAEVYALGEELS